MALRDSPDQFSPVHIELDPQKEGIQIPSGSRVFLMSPYSGTPWQFDNNFRMYIQGGKYVYDGELPGGNLEYKFYIQPLLGAPYWFPDGENRRMTVGASTAALHARIAAMGRTVASDSHAYIAAGRDSLARLAEIGGGLDSSAHSAAARIDEINRGMAADINAAMANRRVTDTAIQYLLYGDIAKMVIQIPAFGQGVERRPELPSSEIEKIRQKIDGLRGRHASLSPNEQHYAEALLNLIGKHSLGPIEHLARHIQSTFQGYVARFGLGAHLSPYSVSKSWTFWDIAKQSYLSQHPEESTSEYHLGDPMSDYQVQSAIIRRHLGWELYRQWKNNPNSQAIVRSALLRLMPERRAEAEQLLNKPAEANGTLRSIDLAKLGLLFTL